jgi:ribonuclease-3
MAISNVPTNDTRVSTCETLIKYTFTDKLLLLQALNASGVPIHYAGEWRDVQKNNVLAILGDAYLDTILCRWWWARSSRHVKEHWTKIRADKSSNAALEVLGKRVGLDECIICNPGTTKISEDMLATAIEAILGAVCDEGREEVLEKVMVGLGFDDHVYL